MKAEDLAVQGWINTTGDVSSEIEKSKVLVVHVFQMLCPGCIYHGIPQTIKLHNDFSNKGVLVLGLHSVFEHHEVMTEAALKVFTSELRLPFPVGVDRSVDGHWMPETMQKFQLQGTPSTLIFDSEGKLCLQHFGALDQTFVENFINDLLNNKQTA